MITALIAEDEEPQRAELCAQLKQLWPELTIVAECEDGLAACEALHRHQPNVVFLDIRMPGVSGVEIARAASSVSHVVFTTAYDEYAVQAFEQGAVDYLLNPIQRERLELAIGRLRQRLLTEAPPDLTELLAHIQPHQWRQGASQNIRWITASAGQNTRFFPIEDVLFFRAQDKYTRVVTLHEEAHIRMPLKDLIAKLDPQVFWQVHRSVIVRYDAIRLVQRNEDGHALLFVRGRDEALPISAVFQHRFRGM